jgi:hypothetical protein
MITHLHVLLEVPPRCEKGESLGLSEEELLRRLGGLYSRNSTAAVAREIEEAKGLIFFEYRRILISAGMEEGEERGNVETKQRVVVRKGMARGNEVEKCFYTSTVCSKTNFLKYSCYVGWPRWGGGIEGAG